MAIPDKQYRAFLKSRRAPNSAETRRRMEAKDATITKPQKPTNKAKRLHISVNTLLKPYDKKLKKPLYNQEAWTNVQYEEAAEDAAALDEALKERCLRLRPKIFTAGTTHLGKVLTDDKKVVLKISLDLEKLKKGNASSKQIASKLASLAVAEEKHTTIVKPNTRHQDEELKRETDTHAVDFVNIFCHSNRAEMKKWRLATKTKFFCFFDGAIEHIHRPVSRGEPENCQSLFDIWQNHMRSSAIKNLDLGTIDNVPTLPSRSVSSATLKLNKLGKTPDVNAIEEEDDDEDEEMMSEGSTEIDYDESVTMG